jgi:hypothetical protein
MKPGYTGWGFSCIEFDDFINEKFLFEENYVARIVVNANFEI